MNLTTIASTNQKGQIVIPYKLRQKLNITTNTKLVIRQQGQAVLLQPIKEVVLRADLEDSYLNLLKKTQGAWQGDSWSNSRKKRKDLEKKASQKRKKQW